MTYVPPADPSPVSAQRQIDAAQGIPYEVDIQQRQIDAAQAGIGPLQNPEPEDGRERDDDPEPEKDPENVPEPEDDPDPEDDAGPGDDPGPGNEDGAGEVPGDPTVSGDDPLFPPDGGSDPFYEKLALAQKVIQGLGEYTAADNPENREGIGSPVVEEAPFLQNLLDRVSSSSLSESYNGLMGSIMQQVGSLIDGDASVGLAAGEVENVSSRVKGEFRGFVQGLNERLSAASTPNPPGWSNYTETALLAGIDETLGGMHNSIYVAESELEEPRRAIDDLSSAIGDPVSGARAAGPEPILPGVGGRGAEPNHLDVTRPPDTGGLDMGLTRPVDMLAESSGASPAGTVASVLPSRGGDNSNTPLPDRRRPETAAPVEGPPDSVPSPDPAETTEDEFGALANLHQDGMRPGDQWLRDADPAFAAGTSSEPEEGFPGIGRTPVSAEWDRGGTSSDLPSIQSVTTLPIDSGEAMDRYITP